jgi:cob(I)alamin adenosyltransferase
MGYRLSKIYTRTGDQGTTTLGDGSRVDKDSIRIEVVGTIDELNSVIGMVLSHKTPKPIRKCLSRVQHELFDLGGEVSIPDHVIIDEAHIKRLEVDLDHFNTDLPHLREFILPGGGRATSVCHLARAVCRRAERCAVSLARTEPLSPQVIAYLNRLSDLLFVVSRVLSRNEGRGEVMWHSPRQKT